MSTIRFTIANNGRWETLPPWMDQVPHPDTWFRTPWYKGRVMLDREEADHLLYSSGEPTENFFTFDGEKVGSVFFRGVGPLEAYLWRKKRSREG